MTEAEFAASRRFAETPFGRIAYVERGAGPVALFFHGAFLNGFQWRDVLEACADERRCIAFDSLGHGHTEPLAGQPADLGAQAEAAAALLDALGVDRVDLVGNDSGGGIAQVFAVRHPGRVRSLCLTDCEVYTNNPAPGFLPIIEAFRAGGGPEIVASLQDPAFARSQAAFGPFYERPDELRAETLTAYLAPLAAPERADAFVRFVASLATPHTVEIAAALRRLEAPALIAWGTADVGFELKWAYWLAGALPRARPVVEVEGARLFWPEERPELLSGLLREHWAAAA